MLGTPGMGQTCKGAWGHGQDSSRQGPAPLTSPRCGATCMFMPGRSQEWGSVPHAQ